MALLAIAGGAALPPAPRLALKLEEPQKQALQVWGAALATRSAVRQLQKPPLRLELGRQEEARLAEVPPPGPLRLIARGVVLTLIFLPTLLTALVARYWRWYRERVWFRLLKRALASAGTAFIKWGQWMSVRPDIFPEQLCGILSELHSQAPTHGYAHTRAEVEAALGAKIGDKFSRFDERPFASGSIAQMHHATLHGQLLAVKVRHPRVVERIQTDFTLMTRLAEWSAAVPGLRWLNLKTSVAQFSSTMVAQTRLDIEAEHLRRFRWNFGAGAWRDVRFPRVLFDSRAVLLESFEPGELVSKYTIQRTLGVGGGEELPRRTAHFVVSRGEDLYLKMLLADNLMHADLHPGNILLHQARTPTLVLLDLGMVARLKPAESQAFIGFLHAVGAGDGARAARRVLKFSEEQTCITPQEFQADMKAFFLVHCRGYGTGVEFGNVLRGVLGLVRKHKVALDANYMTLVMNVLCLEGMARALLPDYNVLDGARPLLTAHRRLPGPLFRVALPLVFTLKKMRDGWHGRHEPTQPASLPPASAISTVV